MERRIEPGVQREARVVQRRVTRVGARALGERDPAAPRGLARHASRAERGEQRRAHRRLDLLGDRPHRVAGDVGDALHPQIRMRGAADHDEPRIERARAGRARLDVVPERIREPFEHRAVQMRARVI
ncbi:hypothetical protein Y046_3881 [Burkholderia pseudomallei MSHR2990]|nr:hypothetical protein Y046_3881 [Burkholderia pseudomallei MSHR2990]